MRSAAGRSLPRPPQDGGTAGSRASSRPCRRAGRKGTQRGERRGEVPDGRNPSRGGSSTGLPEVRSVAGGRCWLLRSRGRASVALPARCPLPRGRGPAACASSPLLGLARRREPGARPALPPTACAAPERLLTFFVSRFSHACPHAANRSEISGGKHRCGALIWLAAERWLPATPTTLSGCHGLRGAGLSPGLGYSFGCARSVPIPAPERGSGCKGCWRIAPGTVRRRGVRSLIFLPCNPVLLIRTSSH